MKRELKETREHETHISPAVLSVCLPHRKKTMNKRYEETQFNQGHENHLSHAALTDRTHAAPFVSTGNFLTVSSLHIICWNFHLASLPSTRSDTTTKSSSGRSGGGGMRDVKGRVFPSVCPLRRFVSLPHEH